MWNGLMFSGSFPLTHLHWLYSDSSGPSLRKEELLEIGLQSDHSKDGASSLQKNPAALPWVGLQNEFGEPERTTGAVLGSAISWSCSLWSCSGQMWGEVQQSFLHRISTEERQSLCPGLQSFSSVQRADQSGAAASARTRTSWDKEEHRLGLWGASAPSKLSWKFPHLLSRGQHTPWPRCLWSGSAQRIPAHNGPSFPFFTRACIAPYFTSEHSSDITYSVPAVAYEAFCFGM